MYSEILEKKIAECLKNGNSVELKVWRAIKAEFINYKTAKAGNVITDDIELKIINKMASQRKDSIEQYNIANRLDLVENETNELNILLSLLPKEPTEGEIINLVGEFVNSYVMKNNSNPTMKDMRDCMNFIKNHFPTVNGGVVSKIFKEKIS